MIGTFQSSTALRGGSERSSRSVGRPPHAANSAVARSRSGAPPMRPPLQTRFAVSYCPASSCPASCPASYPASCPASVLPASCQRPAS
eukprot:19359-Prymnesium_polylepis.1